MIYLISVIIILILSLLGFSLLSKKQKSKQVIVKRNDEQQISYSEIVDNLERQEVEKDLSSHYDFEISSITQNKAVLDILITFINHSDKTTRVDLVKMNYFSHATNQKMEADVTFYGELNMGTNDILLKNTILPHSTLIRNIFFFNSAIKTYSMQDFVEIEVKFNEELFVLKKYLYQADLEQVKIVL